MIAAPLGVKQRSGGVFDESCRRWASKVLRWSGIELQTKGFDKIPADKPVVFVVNHQSFFDILVDSRFIFFSTLAATPLPS